MKKLLEDMNANIQIFYVVIHKMSFNDFRNKCPFHTYFVIPFVNIFTFGIYGAMFYQKRLEDQMTAINKNNKSKIDFSLKR